MDVTVIHDRLSCEELFVAAAHVATSAMFSLIMIGHVFEYLEAGLRFTQFTEEIFRNGNHLSVISIPSSMELLVMLCKVETRKKNSGAYLTFIRSVFAVFLTHMLGK